MSAVEMGLAVIPESKLTMTGSVFGQDFPRACLEGSLVRGRLGYKFKVL